MRMDNAPHKTSTARKVPTNLSVRADLVQQAKALGINLSEVLEHALVEALRQRRREAWIRENGDAIAEYNARVGREGVFSDDWRRF